MCICSESQDTDVSLDISATDLYEANLVRFVNEISNLKEQCCKELTTKCYQLKIYQTTSDEVVREFFESKTQKVMDKIKLIEDQWRTLDVWEIVQSVNPRPILEFSTKALFQQGVQLLKDRPDKMIFRKSFVLCCIEHAIINTVGKLVMQVAEQDRSNLLDCMQNAMINVRANGCIQDYDKLRSLLIPEKNTTV